VGETAVGEAAVGEAAEVAGTVKGRLEEKAIEKSVPGWEE
jgi:hypothetical protein